MLSAAERGPLSAECEAALRIDAYAALQQADGPMPALLARALQGGPLSLFDFAGALGQVCVS